MPGKTKPQNILKLNPKFVTRFLIPFMSKMQKIMSNFREKNSLSLESEVAFKTTMILEKGWCICQATHPQPDLSGYDRRRENCRQRKVKQ